MIERQPSPIRVLHLILTLERAGAQEVLRSLVARHRADCQTAVATFFDGEVRADIEALGVPVDVLGPREHGIETPLKFVGEQRSLRSRLLELVERHGAQIVHTHILHTLDFLALTLPAKVVWTVHNVDYLPEGPRGWSRCKRLAHRWLYRHLAGRFAAIVAISREVGSVLETDLRKAPLTVIPNGVDATRFGVDSDRTGLRAELGVAPDAPIVLTLGRLTPQKGQVHLVRAMARVFDSHPEALLVVVGEGELRDELRAAADATGHGERVHFLGLRRDVPRLLASVDVFALPSLWEGLSVALLEAMASALPIVATAVSGTSDVLAHGETGLIVEPGDEASLTRAIDRLLSDTGAARAMGARARKLVEEAHSDTVQADRYLQLYRDVLAG